MKKARARTDKGRAAAVSAGPALETWHYWAALGAAFLVLCIVYWPAVDGPFVFPRGAGGGSAGRVEAIAFDCDN